MSGLEGLVPVRGSGTQSKPTTRPAAQSMTRLGIALVVVGLLLRLWATVWMDLHSDGGSFAAIGYSVSQGHGFTMPWGDEIGGSTPAPSHHFSPLWPAVLAGFYSVLGFGVWQTKLAAIIVSLGALAVVWACTRDLMDSGRAWLATGILAVVPRLVIVTGQGYSENLVLALFTVTLWAIIRSLSKPSFIVWAGLAAGLTYLARAQMGSLFIIAGAGGVAWRLRFRGWAALRDQWYLAAAGVFGTLWAGWTLRNVAHFGLRGWQSSAYAAMVQDWAFGHPGLLGLAVVSKLGFFGLLLLLFILVWEPELRSAAANAGTERDSALWLSAVLVVVLGAITAAMFWTYERTDLWWTDSERYLLLAYLPVLWLILYHAKVKPEFVKRSAAAGAAFLLVGGFMAIGEYHFPQVEAVQGLHDRLGAGVVVGVDYGLSKYDVFPYVGPGRAVIVTCPPLKDPCGGQTPDFIIHSRRQPPPTGYKLDRVDRVDYGFANLTAWTYARSVP